MKRINYLLLVLSAFTMATACNNVRFKKTKSGILYKIIPSSSKDSIVKEGNYLKFHITQKVNDSIINTSNGKMPVYQRIANIQPDYNPGEVFAMLKKGDSAVVIMLVDSLIRKGFGQELPPYMKKGDRLIIELKVLDIFRNDSTYNADMNAEYVKDAPRQQKEQEEQMAKMAKEREDQQKKNEETWEKSGQIAKEIKDLQSYFAAKNISVQQVGKGTFVHIDQQGTGPQVANGKYVGINYVGKHLDTDSTFDKGTFVRPLGKGALIIGLEDGLIAFKQGGKGTVYVAGFRAYGENPGPNSPFKPFEAMKFDVEVLNVSDTEPTQGQMPPRN